MRPMRDASLSKHGQHRGAGRRALPLLVLIWLLLAWMAPARQTLAAAPLGDPVARTGRLTVKWGDGRSGSSSVIFTLSAKGQGEAQVLIDAALARRHGGIVALDRRRVTIRGRWVEADGPGPRAIRAEAIEPAPNTNESSTDSEALAGSQPWINALCKFADVSSEPRDPGYFDGLVGETAPGLGHYWREASYESLSILGSGSSGWYTLPETRSYYLSLSSSQMLNELFADCTAAADSAVDFSGYHGLNLMFNDELDGSAWGGSVHATLDGESRFWPTTWLPPWAYGNQAVVAHEMGHGFGLPHSSGDYGLTYDNQWDVMSDTWSNCARASDPTYGCLGQHTIGHHKDMLEWIPEALQYQASEGVQTVTLERLALPETDSYRIAVIPIDDSTSHFYTVEARNWAGYDVKLPGEAVIIHEVDTTRSRPAHVVDVDGNGDTGDEGAMWVVGETFSDPDHQIHVAVDSASLSGYTITITLGDVLPTRTPTETATPTVAATSTSTPTQTPTPTDTPSPTATDTQMPPTATSTSTDTPEPTPTHTPEPTDTPSPTATDTPVPPTATPTSTETPEPTATHTPAPTDKPDPTNTPEPTDTPTSTATPQPTETAQATDTPPPTATDTPAPTDTYTPQPTSTHTPQPTATCPPPAFSESRGKSKGRFGDSPPFEVAPNSPCFQPPGPRQPIPWLFEKLSEDLDWLKSIVRILGRF